MNAKPSNSLIHWLSVKYGCKQSFLPFPANLSNLRDLLWNWMLMICIAVVVNQILVIYVLWLIKIYINRLLLQRVYEILITDNNFDDNCWIWFEVECKLWIIPEGYETIVLVVVTVKIINHNFGSILIQSMLILAYYSWFQMSISLD